MKAVLAQFVYEANTFCPVLTGLDNFRESGTWLEGSKAVRNWASGCDTQMSGSLRVLDKTGWESTPVFACICGAPGGRLTRDCFQTIRRTFLERIAEALPCDALILHLHGANCAEGEDDVDGNLLESVRQELDYRGRLILTLDLHANVTQRLLQNADAVTAYHTMPHCDFGETGERGAHLAIQNKSAVRAMAKIAALIPATDTDHRKGRFAEMVQRARHAEKHPDIDDVGLFPVQAWMDIANLGTSVVVTGRGDQPARVARELAETWYAQRHDWATGLQDWDTILQKLLTSQPRCWYLVDTADCTTGGSSGTSAEILSKLLPVVDRLPGPVFLHIVDPKTVAAARSGASRFRMGHQQLGIEAKVIHVSEGTYKVRGKFFGGIQFSMGGAAVLQHGKVFIVAASKPTLGIDPTLYECVGLDPSHAHAVHVRSLMGWRVNFDADDSQALLFDGPGATRLSFAALDFTGERRDLFPLNPNPPNPIQLWQST